jgi:hypothetical protein
MATQALDYYEFLQISPNADFETIHRVYRFLAARFHPDNPDSGDPEKFYALKTAYDILSDPAQRAKYDAECAANGPAKQPMSTTVDFMDNLQGELNRRLAVLAVLYYQRRSNPYNPEVSLPEIEKRMGFPRDYLDFTTWYLTRKGYVTKADNSDFSLTAEGVDFVEAQRVKIPVLNKLLTSGAEAAVSAAAQASISALDNDAAAVCTPASQPHADETPAPVITEAEVPSATRPVTDTQKSEADNGPAIRGIGAIKLSELSALAVHHAPTTAEKLIMVGKALFGDRRINSKERRAGAFDWRNNKVERRKSALDRRARS